MFKSFGRKIFQSVTFSKIFFPTITKKFKSLGQTTQNNVLNTCAHNVANLTRSTKTKMNFFLHKNMTLASSQIEYLAPKEETNIFKEERIIFKKETIISFPLEATRKLNSLFILFEVKK